MESITLKEDLIISGIPTAAAGVEVRKSDDGMIEYFWQSKISGRQCSLSFGNINSKSDLFRNKAIEIWNKASEQKDK